MLTYLSIKDLKFLLKHMGVSDTLQMFEQLGIILEGNSYTNKEYENCLTAVTFIDKHKSKLVNQYGR